MKKKILLSLLAIVVCITLVGCGDKENTSGENSGNGGSEQSGGDLKSVSTSNYKSVVKDFFGIDVIDVSGWEIEKAESLNGVNNLDLKFRISTKGDNKDILKQYYDKALAVSSDGIYSYTINFDTYKMSKDTKYNSFEEVYDASSSYDDFYQMEFIYDSNGKNIYFTITIDEDLEVADISFTYC